MKKLFLTICFLIPCFAEAAIREVSSIEAAKIEEKYIGENLSDNQRQGFGNFSQDDWNNFIINRIKTSKIEDIPKSERSSSGLTSIIPSDEELARINKPKESLFKKMYKDAINRFSNKEASAQTHSNFADTSPQLKNIANQQINNKSNVATIPVTIPYINQTTNVAAVPHIPFFFADIEVLSTGDVLIEENFVVVNSKAKAYKKSFNKYLVDRQKQKKEIELELLSVSINSQDVEYKKTEDSNSFYLSPKENSVLASGIYEYKIKYILKNNLSFYENFDEFFFNITGINNLVIARSGVFITIPEGFELISQVPFIELNNILIQKNIVALPEVNNSYGYIATLPIVPGSGLYLMTSIKKGGVIKPDFSRIFWAFFNTHQDIIFAFLGFVVIFGAYLISLKSLNSAESKQNITPKRTAPLMRYMYLNKLDIKSLVAFILELYKINIIDIVKNDNTVLLIKKTDATTGLSKYERSCLNELFINNESVLSVTSYNILKLKRGLLKLQAGLKNSLKTFVYKLNSRYLMFSFSMLFITLLGISSGHINTIEVFVACAIIVAFFVLASSLSLIKTQNKYTSYALKSLSAIINIFFVFVLSYFISFDAALFIFLIVVAIFVFSLLFVKRSGLLSRYIADIDYYKNILNNKIKQGISPKDFATQQAFIFALDLEELLEKETALGEVNKLALAQEILKIYNRKK